MHVEKWKKNKFIILLLPLLLTLLSKGVVAQEDSVVTEQVVKLKYFSENNSMQYLVVESVLKTGKKTEPLGNKIFQVYLDSSSAENLIAKVVTGKNGKAKCFLPTSLKTLWDGSTQHKFIVLANGNEEPVAELEIAKAKIKIDTASADGARSITVLVTKYENDEWIPAADVEMKVGIQRLGGILTAGDEETYTTDSSGTVTVEVTKDSLPGNEKGNIVLAAKVEDNELYGNMLVVKTVQWGVAVKTNNHFFEQRTLWSTSIRTPYWLLFMAYSIVLGVWGTILYLIIQLIKIKRLGKIAGADETV